ncbi:MAG: hypothetical protein KDA89_23960 [Planctomycetaceae bacterium]|nr:hypothetical protein [Planctomycetaceae bacterium]
MNLQSTETHRPKVHTAAERLPRLRRSAFGVRGAWLNDITRPIAELLASVISDHLAGQGPAARQRPPAGQRPLAWQRSADGRTHTDSQRYENGQAFTEAAEDHSSQPVVLVVGFDDSPGAPDIFAGITSALLRNGADVADAGHCTAASLLHACRRQRNAAAALFVTGIGGRAGDIGVDIYDRFGHAVSIPWRRYGLSIQLPCAGAKGVVGVAATAGGKGEHSSPAVSLPTNASLSAVPYSDRFFAQQNAGNDGVLGSDGVIVIPKHLLSSTRSLRSVRHSGTRRAFDAEADYRRRLLRWWPADVATALEVVTTSRRTEQRLRWLAAERNLNIHVITSENSGGGIPMGTTTLGHFDLRTTVNPDDRFVTIQTARGRTLSAAEVADWINRSVHPGIRHVTAHPGFDYQTVILTDIAEPNSADGQEQICDALIVTGLVLTLTLQYRLPS